MILQGLVSLVMVAALGACGASAGSRAETGLRAYIEALRLDDPKPAYQLLSREEQRRIDYETWAQEWKDSRAEREQQAVELEATLKTSAIVREEARLRFDDGKVVRLTRGPRGWRLEHALINRTQAQVPEDAVVLFATALRERDVVSVLRLLSERQRRAIEERLDHVLRGLDDALDDPNQYLFQANEERATMTWTRQGVRYKLTLVREHGEWRIDDLHLGPDPLTPPTEERVEEANPEDAGNVPAPTP